VQAFVDGQSSELTPTEFKLLYRLALPRGRVVTRDELLSDRRTSDTAAIGHAEKRKAAEIAAFRTMKRRGRDSNPRPCRCR
jgi:hypothetical protein